MRRVLPCVAATVLATLTVATPAHAAGSAPVHYVALGDSYTAAPLVGAEQPGSPLGCLRTVKNYPSQIAAALHPASFTDVSCSGAETGDMTKPQTFSVGAANPAQFDALHADTTLVTLTIGGNDIGFSGAAETCVKDSLSDPHGAPCKAHYTAGGTDQLAQRIAATAPKVAAVLAGIHSHAPNAKVYLLTYPLILPATGHGCFPFVPVAWGDVRYLAKTEAELNAMLGAQAAAADTTLVHTDAPGHDACQPAKRRWIEGIPTQWAAPAHPNLTGETAMAHLTLAAINS